MSNLKSIEVEQQKYFITERLVQVRANVQLGITDPKTGQAELDILRERYLEINRTAEDIDLEDEDDRTWDDLLEGDDTDD